jgi:uncharacterized protein (DUF58 family)
LAKLEQLHLLSRKIFRGQHHGERRTRQIGTSLEFADYRNYTPGDDLRTVDWNIYGRLDRLFVKLFEAEQDLHVTILVDCSESMRWKGLGTSSKFDHARKIAAALAYIALSNMDRVNLFAIGSNLGADLGFVRGKKQFHAVLEFLKRLQPMPGDTKLLSSTRTFSKKLKRRGLVFLLSDLLDPEATETLTSLRQQQFDVVAIQILDPAELSPDLTGDVQLQDTETGISFDALADGSLLDRYKREFTRFLSELDETCRQRGIGYIQTSNTVPFEDLVLRVLRERQLVK